MFEWDKQKWCFCLGNKTIDNLCEKKIFYRFLQIGMTWGVPADAIRPSNSNRNYIHDIPHR